ncbi:hypothetical protein FQA39_LY09625 [Lamprigera yunnana]|nr:hypothetical protein FQA39_LY09625 [Lamprigera yunnana]
MEGINWRFFFNTIDESFVEEYTEKIVNSQSDQLNLLKNDLANWINFVLDIRYLTGANLLHELDNGAVLCQLGLLILRKAEIAAISGCTSKDLPKIKKKYFKNAMRGSFFSRDNMENFIKFCKSLGVHENLLFESDDLVLQNNPRNVILCLLEVARLSTQFGIDPPNLIGFEKELAEEKQMVSLDYHTNLQICWQFQPLPPVFLTRNSTSLAKTLTQTSITSDLIPYEEFNSSEYKVCPSPDTEVAVKVIKDELLDVKLLNDTNKSLNELDKRVEHTLQLLHLRCRCVNKKFKKLRIKKIGEGRYTIAGRNIFVRLLKDCHMVVRVGGGWDTLEHFLKRYDPCQGYYKSYWGLKMYISESITGKENVQVCEHIITNVQCELLALHDIYPNGSPVRQMPRSLQLWLFPQLTDDSNDFIFKQDRAPPQWHNEIRQYLNADLPDC